MESAKNRLSSIASQLTPAGSSGRDLYFQKNPDDVVITYAVRTPLTKARKGGLKDTPLDDMLISILKTAREQSNVDPSVVEDVCLGNVLHPGASYVARAAVLAAGYPVTTSTSVASRWCSSGLLATQQIANQIIAGSIDCGIAIGAESMSLNPDSGAPEISSRALESPTVQDATQPMGWTSENVARDFNISREAQDAFAARSQNKAEIAQIAGWTAEEIAPVTTKVKDQKSGEWRTITVTEDDGVRHGTTAEGLAKIRPAFPQWPPATTTGGNASQVTDGAALLLLMRRSLATKLHQPILGKFAACTVVGLEPRVMGIGPTFSIPKLLNKTKLSMDDIDIFEINEAFSSMGVYCIEKLGIPIGKFNPRGGAVALGHPLGCTGARQIVTVLSEMRRTKKKLAITSMCVGTGHSMAGLIVSEQ